MLSLLGPAVQLQGGSRLISASSFWILRMLLFDKEDDVVAEAEDFELLLETEDCSEDAFGDIALPLIKIGAYF